MTRYDAYLSFLKWHFQGFIRGGINRRAAWKLARYIAAEDAFRATTEHLTSIRL